MLVTSLKEISQSNISTVAPWVETEVLLGNRSLRLKKDGMVFVQADDLHTVHARDDRSVLLAVQFSPALHTVCGARSGRDPSVVIEARCAGAARCARARDGKSAGWRTDVETEELHGPQQSRRQQR
jgi:hypothetical protein